jgi:protein-tyrosine phosphatase
MIDLHSHVLPGLDDGAATLEESREIGRLAVEDGVRTLAATPHVREDYPTTPETMEVGVDVLRRDFAASAIALEIVPGGEIGLDRLGALGPDQLARFTLGQTGRYLLVEFPYRVWPRRLEDVLRELAGFGLTAVLAHPERNAEVQRDPGRLEEPVRAGALVQLTAGSVEGRLGGEAKATADRLLELSLAHLLASDAHAPALREGRLGAAVDAIGDEELARYLTEEAPKAVLAGEPVPPPPQRRRRRFGLRIR